VQGTVRDRVGKGEKGIPGEKVIRGEAGKGKGLPGCVTDQTGKKSRLVWTRKEGGKKSDEGRRSSWDRFLAKGIQLYREKIKEKKDRRERQGERKL